VSGTAKTFSFKIKVNPPGAPVVKSAVSTLPSNGLTNNPGFTWTSGGGGNGKYRVKVNTEASYRVNGVVQTTFSLANSDADGTYIVYVSEQDDMGRWGPDGNFAIQLDRTVPVYTEIFFKGTTLTVRDGYVTNLDTLTLTYKADGVGKELGCKLDASGAARICKATNTDGAGNSSTLQRTFYSRTNVVFFKPVATGARDGTSWENARSDLKGYLDLPAVDIQGKDLWLASGDYSGQDLEIYFKTANIYGGFNAAAFPIDPNSRIKNITLLGFVSLFSGLGTPQQLLDGVRLTKGLAVSGQPMAIKDCQSLGTLSITEGSIIAATNFELTGAGKDYSALFIGTGAKVTWDGGRITDNPTTGDYYSIRVDGASLILKGSMIVSGNENPNLFGMQILNSGSLIIESSVSFDCKDIQNEGTGSCRGTPLE
jgi:hypothetical protein